LQKKIQQINNLKKANQIYEITGGRFNLIKEAVDNVEKGNSIETIQQNFMIKQRDEFDRLLNLKLKSDVPLFEVIDAILKSKNKEISINEFKKKMGIYSNDVLSLNVFSHRKGRVGFQNKPMEKYAKENEEDLKAQFKLMATQNEKNK